MYIIDLHTHVYPEEIAQKATDSVKNYYHIGGAGMNGTVELLLQRNKEAGISKSVILPVAIRADHVHSINDFILGQVEQHDCFIGFGTVHAGMDGLSDEVERICNVGLKGIKMHPDMQRFPIDDPRLFPMYEAISGRIPVLLHMGDHNYDYSHPARLRHVLNLFPKLDAVAAHFGGYSMYDTACELLKDTSCVMDISSSLMFMQPGEAERYIDIYGAERMAFGSDYPLWDPVQEVNRFLEMKLTEEQKEQIAHKTVERLLKL